MRRRPRGCSERGDVQCNLTPMIDVVFLLITFFLLIFRSMGGENYRLWAPADCAAAVQEGRGGQGRVTVSVFPAEAEGREASLSPEGAGPGQGAWSGPVRYAVRERLFDPEQGEYAGEPGRLTAALAAEIERAGAPAAEGAGVAELRADRRLSYGQVQRALEALARAKIGTVRLAAYRDEVRVSPTAPGGGR